MADKYIKASDCEKYFYEHLDDNGMIGAMNAIDEMPAADVKPVVHAHWIKVTPKHSRCSCCDVTCLIAVYPTSADANFCPNCGADMRGGSND